MTSERAAVTGPGQECDCVADVSMLTWETIFSACRGAPAYRIRYMMDLIDPHKPVWETLKGVMQQHQRWRAARRTWMRAVVSGTTNANAVNP